MPAMASIILFSSQTYCAGNSNASSYCHPTSAAVHFHRLVPQTKFNSWITARLSLGLIFTSLFFHHPATATTATNNIIPSPFILVSLSHLLYTRFMPDDLSSVVPPPPPPPFPPPPPPPPPCLYQLKPYSRRDRPPFRLSRPRLYPP